jgi:hypothetical protein
MVTDCSSVASNRNPQSSLGLQGQSPPARATGYQENPHPEGLTRVGFLLSNSFQVLGSLSPPLILGEGWVGSSSPWMIAKRFNPLPNQGYTKSGYQNWCFCTLGGPHPNPPLAKGRGLEVCLLLDKSP